MKPDNAGTGLVIGQFGLGVVDSADSDMEPEVIPLAGTVTFTPNVPYLPNPTAEPNPITIVTSAITAVLDHEGYVCTPGPDGITPYYRGVRLFATDDPDLSVENWTWSVVYTFQPVNGIVPKIPAHSMSLLEGETIDLATVVPVPSSPGIGTPQALALLQQAVEAAGTVAGAQALMQRAEDAADRAEAPTDQMMASTASNPASQFSGVLDDVIDERTPDLIEATMGSVVGGLVAESIAADPTVANAAAAAVDANPKIGQLEAADWFKDVVMVSGDSLDAFVGVTPGKQVKAKIATATVAQNVVGWPAGLNYQGASVVTYGLTSSVSLQQLQTHSNADPRLYIRTVGQAWKRIGDPTGTAGSLTSIALSADQDLFLLDSGSTATKEWFLANNPTDWVAQHLPVNARGAVSQFPVGSSRVMTYLTFEPTPRFYAIQRNGAVWGAWTQIGAPASPQGTVESKPASGMKRIGVPITAGHAGADAPLEATVRMPLLYSAPVFRWALRFRDINPRSGTTRSGAINISSIWFGKHGGSGVMNEGVKLTDAFTIPDGAVEFQTKFFNTPLVTDVEHLLSFGYTKASAPWAMLGYSYQTADDADAGIPNPAGMTKLGTAPFSISIVAETYNTTPVVCSISDSNGVGVGAANGLHDSWLSQLCRRIKALPDHRGSSGDTMLASQDGQGYKYRRFDGLSKPDVLLQALGQNDAAQTDQTLAVMQSRLATVMANSSTVADTVYLVNLMPRTNNPWAGFEDLRRLYNGVLAELPGGAIDVYDIASAISDDDETIRAVFDSDGTHLNAAGFGAVQASFTRPVTSPPVQYVAI